MFHTYGVTDGKYIVKIVRGFDSNGKSIFVMREVNASHNSAEVQHLYEYKS